jgi:hypothetical protein
MHISYHGLLGNGLVGGDCANPIASSFSSIHTPQDHSLKLLGAAKSQSKSHMQMHMAFEKAKDV